jgi:hypothetical protein
MIGSCANFASLKCLLSCGKPPPEGVSTPPEGASEESEIRKATRAGVLVMVVRTQHWRPQAGDTIRYAVRYIPPHSTTKKSGKHSTISKSILTMITRDE